MAACRALSQRNADPAKASRPWDSGRDGFVMGEGAGVLVMESLEHAQKRGAKILGEYLGGAVTCDAYHMTDPRADGLGVKMCIEKALKDSNIERDQVSDVSLCTDGLQWSSSTRFAVSHADIQVGS